MAFQYLYIVLKVSCITNLYKQLSLSCYISLLGPWKWTTDSGLQQQELIFLHF